MQKVILLLLAMFLVAPQSDTQNLAKLTPSNGSAPGELPSCLTQNAPIQYVDEANGRDSNSGCSWAQAKQYAKTAWLALYHAIGLAQRTHGGGTIYFTDSGSGLYWDATGNTAAIIGPFDPNWSSCTASPCTVGSLGLSWVKEAAISLQGVGCTDLGGGGVTGGPFTAVCYVQFGVNDRRTLKVGLQISGTDSTMNFNGLGLINMEIPVAIGLDSNGSTGSYAQTAGLSFENFNLWPRCSNSIPGRHGPGVLFGSGFSVYWVNGAISGCDALESWTISSVTRSSNVDTFKTSTAHHLAVGDPVFIAGVTDSSFDLTAFRVATVPDTTHFTVSQTAPNATSSGGTVFGPGSAAVLFDAKGNYGGSSTFHNVHFNNGGVKYAGTAGASGSSVDYPSLSEALATNDAFWWQRGQGFVGQDVGNVDVQLADQGTNVAVVRLGSQSTAQVQLPGMVRGDAVCGSAYAIGQICNAGEYGVETSGGTGFSGDKVFGRYDDWRHGGFYIHLYANQVSTLPANWKGTTVRGVPGPYAIQGGADASAGSVTNAAVTFGSWTGTAHNGDWIIAKGMWRFISVPAPSSVGPLWNLTLSGGGCTAQLIDPRDSNVISTVANGITFGTDTYFPAEWESNGGLFQVYSPAGNQTCTVTFKGQAVSQPNNNIVAYYDPTLQIIPSTDMGFAQVAQTAMYEPPFPSSCPVLTLCPEALNSIQPAAVSVIIFAKLPQTAPNGTMLVVSDGKIGSPCTGGGSGALAVRIGGIWACK